MIPRNTRGLSSRLLLALIIIQLFFVSNTQVRGWEPATDYNVVTLNGQYLFVMLCLEREGDGVDPVLRNRYPQSGLYLNDGSATLLWSVDWYTYNVDVSSDGHHVVGWFEPRGAYDVALAFYENGRSVKEYSINDLKSNYADLEGITWVKEEIFDDHQGQLWVRTIDDQEYRFDITTGEIISQTNAPQASTVTRAPTEAAPATTDDPTDRVVSPTYGASTPTHDAAQPGESDSRMLVAIGLVLVTLTIVIGGWWVYMRRRSR
jgi:hypothetical protein